MIKVFIIVLNAAVLIFLFGCSGGKLTVDESYSELRPVKQLELPEQIKDNLIITLDNVADEGSSFKNRVELLINDRRIEPNWLVSNVENTFTYKLKVRPGYYDVKAFYYAYIGWGDNKYKIEAQELVRVSHDQCTRLTCEIAKKTNGEPVNKNMHFKATFEPFNQTTGEK
jgi:hypothetical protein